MKTDPFLITLAVSSGLMTLGSITGVVLQSRFKITIDQLGPRWTLLVKVFYLIFFGVMGFSLVPVVFNFFLFVQIGIGNGDLVPIRWLAANELQAVYCIWGLFFVGLVIALTAAIKDGLSS